MNVEQYSIEIKNKLKQDGYNGKKINYAEFQHLHQLYGNQLPEKDFALYILEIKIDQYYDIKNKHYKTTILKEQLSKFIEHETDNIKNQLLTKGYVGKLINYTELQELHQTYGALMPEDIFAKHILELSPTSYLAIKGKNRKRHILSNLQDKTSENIEEIKEMLRLEGYAGKLINYQELQKLHKTFGIQLSEIRFAMKVLEIGENSYLKSKNHGAKIIILKSLMGKTSQEELTKIKEVLKEDGYAGQTIDYIKLQELHQTYGKQMLESEFAQKILEITYSYYTTIKSNPKKRAVILKSLLGKKMPLEKAEQIKEKLLEQGYQDKLIDYDDFQILYKKFGNQMTESEFAYNILEITYRQYQNIKFTKNKFPILASVSTVIEQKEIQKLKQELAAQGYVEKSINYEELQTLHKTYGSHMDESKFARDVLEINASLYKYMKKNLRNAIILKSLNKQLSQEELNRILQELEFQGYSGKKINYQDFQNIYKQYGAQMPEYKFAQDILGISTALLGNLRHLPNAKAKILKNYTLSRSPEEIESIKQILEEKGYGGRLINYSELQILHQMYAPEMKEDVFAQVVLEIPLKSSYQILKDESHKTRILISNKKINLIRNILFKEARWYTKEEIEQICFENNISLDKIIRQIASNGTNIYNVNYKKVLEEKGKLWIGKSKFSDEFIKQNYNELMKWAKIELKCVKSRYHITYNSEDEDMMQNAVLYLIENAGEIEKNFLDYPDILRAKIFSSIKKDITLSVLKKFKLKAKTISYNQKLTKSNNQKNEQNLISKIANSYNLESEIINAEIKEQTKKSQNINNKETNLVESCIQEMKNQIEKGLSRQEILNNIEEQFSLSKEKLLEMMQQYLLTNGKIKIEKGQASWTSALEEGK